MFDKKELEKIAAGQREYDGKLEKFLQKSPESRKIEANRLYTPLDADGSDYMEKTGFPGEYPFTRGIQPTMYRGRFWTMRQ
jgi:methylmalonyl-CoA mutase N-terminal domain/subunit